VHLTVRLVEVAGKTLINSDPGFPYHWADPNPIPPWEFRRGARGSSAYQPEQPKAPPSLDSDTIVYITRTGSKYHRDECMYLRKSRISTTFEAARANGYGACSVCNPPR